MESKLALFGHPLHAMLVALPVGLLLTSFLFDLAYCWRRDPFWRRGAFWLILLGMGGVGLSILTGLFDYATLPMRFHARQAANAHLLGGLAVAALYAVQLWARRRDGGPAVGSRPLPPALLLLALASAGVVGLQGFLGGQLTLLHGVGVRAERARPDAVTPAGTLRPGSPASHPSGALLYRQQCAGCHGDLGQGGLGPAFTSMKHGHEPSELAHIIRNGRAPMMPAFKDQLSAEEIQAVADFVRGLGARGSAGRR